MVKKTNNASKIVAGIFIALTAILSGLYTFELTEQEHIFYCESRDLVGYCEKLSSGIGTRCYYNETYKICEEGWQPIEQFVNYETYPETVKVFANGKLYNCEVINGEVQSYSHCTSPIGTEAYMGELI